MKSNEAPVKIQVSKHRDDPVIIRGHTLLCLQGFRGEGYGPEFIENMTSIHARLQLDPGTQVRITDAPDHFCRVCPNLKEGCTLRGPDFEEHIVFQDHQVLELLGLEVGQKITWTEVLTRIGSRMHGEMLDGICGDCQWLALGTCKEGIEKLRQSVSGGK